MQTTPPPANVPTAVLFYQAIATIIATVIGAVFGWLFTRKKQSSEISKTQAEQRTLDGALVLQAFEHISEYQDICNRLNMELFEAQKKIGLLEWQAGESKRNAETRKVNLDLLVLQNRRLKAVLTKNNIPFTDETIRSSE